MSINQLLHSKQLPLMVGCLLCLSVVSCGVLTQHICSTEKRVRAWLRKAGPDYDRRDYFERGFCNHRVGGGLSDEEWLAIGKKCGNITPILRHLLASQDDKIPLWSVAYTLGLLGDTNSVDALATAMKHNDAQLRRAAVFALHQAVLSSLSDQPLRAAIGPLCEAATKDDDDEVRCNAVIALVSLAFSPEARRAVEVALNDPDPEVVREAEIAMVRFRYYDKIIKHLP